MSWRRLQSLEVPGGLCRSKAFLTVRLTVVQVSLAHQTRLRQPTKDDKEEPQGSQGPGTDITLVLEGVNHEHQNRAGDELGEEHARPRHEWCWIGTKDTG